jgi:hypothetical protein
LRFHRPDALAVDLVFQWRLLKRCAARRSEHLQQIVGAEIADSRFRRMRDLQIGFDAIDVLRSIRSNGPSSASNLGKLIAGQRQIAGSEPSSRDLGAGSDAPLAAFSPHHDVERHR